MVSIASTVREVGLDSERTKGAGLDSAIGAIISTTSFSRGISSKTEKEKEHIKTTGSDRMETIQNEARKSGRLMKGASARAATKIAVTLARARRNCGSRSCEIITEKGSSYLLRASMMSDSRRASSSSEICFFPPVKRAATASENEPLKKTSMTFESADCAASDFSVAG